MTDHSEYFAKPWPCAHLLYSNATSSNKPFIRMDVNDIFLACSS